MFFLKQKSLFNVISIVSLMSAQVAFAQYSDLNAEVDAEIEQMYKVSQSNQQSSAQSEDFTSNNNASGNNSRRAAKSNKSVNGAVVTQTVVWPQAAPTQDEINSLNVQKQPENLIESTPLSASRAEAIRKGRQEEELRTETRIVEKLEESRLEDEKRRANVLFGDRFNQLQKNQNAEVQKQNSNQAVQDQQVQVQNLPLNNYSSQPIQAPSQSVAPQPIVIQQNESLTRDAVREEVRAALTEDKSAIEPLIEQKYFSAAAAIGQYPEVSSISGNYSLGAAFGTRFDLFLVEGGFVYSNYQVNARYVDLFNYKTGQFDMNQYQGYLAGKYQLLGGFVRPVVGGLISYSYREYLANDLTVSAQTGSQLGTSHAIDLGLVTGIDLEFNEKMTLGVDLKYMFNMSHKLSGPTVPGYTPVEKLQYFTTGIFARVNF